MSTFIYSRLIQCPRLAFNHEIYDLLIINNVCTGRECLTDNVHEMEDDRQEGPTQQIPQSSEVGDGAVVWVDSSGPHTVNHHAGQVEQQPHLEHSSCEVQEEELD